MPPLLDNPRSISSLELAILGRAAAVAPTTRFRPEMLDPIDSLQVAETCDCGCATVWFVSLSNGVPSTIVADALATSPDGQSMQVIVWALSGSIAGLEVVGFSESPTPLPTLESVRPYDVA